VSCAGRPFGSGSEQVGTIVPDEAVTGEGWGEHADRTSERPGARARAGAEVVLLCLRRVRYASAALHDQMPHPRHPPLPAPGRHVPGHHYAAQGSGRLRLTIGELKKRYGAGRSLRSPGIELRGFIIGTALAYELGAGFVPIRKRGKLPGQTIGTDYELEHGADRAEMHVDAVSRGERLLLVDDLIVTARDGRVCAPIDIEGRRSHGVLPRSRPAGPGRAQAARGTRMSVFALADIERD
jgi:adenine phosphoribosyltransferase